MPVSGSCGSLLKNNMYSERPYQLAHIFCPCARSSTAAVDWGSRNSHTHAYPVSPTTSARTKEKQQKNPCPARSDRSSDGWYQYLASRDHVFFPELGGNLSGGGGIAHDDKHPQLYSYVEPPPHRQALGFLYVEQRGSAQKKNRT